MSLFAVKLNDGAVQVVEAPNKNAAQQYALRGVKVEVHQATKAELAGLDLSTVPDVLKGGKTQAEIDAAAAKEADRKAKAAEKAATA